MSSVVSNDVFHDLLDENKRLLNELLFANRCLNLFIGLKTRIVFHENQIKSVLEPNIWNIIEEYIKKFDCLVAQRRFNCSSDTYKSIGTQTNEESDDYTIDDKKNFNVSLEDKSDEKPLLHMSSSHDINDQQKRKSDSNDSVVSMRLKAFIEDKQRSRTVFVCHHQNCNYQTSTTRSLKDHFIAKHNDGMSSGKRKNVIEKKTDSEDKSQKTDQIDCSVEEDLICEFCQKVFPNPKSLERHRKIQHLRSKCIPCTNPGCDYIAISEKALELHMTKHSDERPFACSFDGCSKTFKTEIVWKNHLRNHYNEDQVKCDFDGCGKTFKSQLRLTEHQKCVHIRAKEYLCDWPGCEFKTHRLNSYKKHKITHSDHYEFVCDHPGCTSKFKFKADLKRHTLQTHDNNRRFECSWPGCQYIAHFKFQLNKHEKTHTNEKPFACDWPGCQYRANERGNVNKHMIKHNKI